MTSIIEPEGQGADATPSDRDQERAMELLEKFNSGTITNKELNEARVLLRRTGTFCGAGGEDTDNG